ncbi:MAG: DUF1844 domain-containing protein [Nitrospiraceae bacterium]
MSAESDSPFVVRDKRGRSAEADAPPAPQAASSAPQAAPSAAQAPVSPQSAQATDTHAHEHAAAPLSFSSFVFSMGTSALMLMGEQLDPRQAPGPVNLDQAKEIIDILSILETKTKGNLTSEEQSIMTDMLYALRMKFVELSSGKGSVLAR